MAEVTLKALLAAGAHFGHQTRRWNPKMGKYIYGARGGVHIIDLTKTKPALEAAEQFVERLTAGGGSVLFVGTKRQAKDVVQAAAQSAEMPYVTQRWLGGMLTNFRTIRLQVNRYKKLAAQAESGELSHNYNKKEAADLTAEMEKLEHIFGGIKNMDSMPAAVFVVDMLREQIAVLEATKLSIPVVAICDSNANPDLVAYPIPANDDAIKSIQVITQSIAEAATRGRAKHQAVAKEEKSEEKEQPAVKPEARTKTEKK